MYFIYVDGASRGNPGKSACACVIMKDRKSFHKKYKYLGPDKTNNYAEYQGVILGMEQAFYLRLDHITIFSDSKLVVRQVTNKWSVLAKTLKPLNREVKRLSRGFDSFKIKLIPRGINKKADELCNLCLDKELSKK